MRKIIGTIIIIMVSIGLIVGCGKKIDEQSQSLDKEIKEKTSVKVIMPDGLPAIAMVKMIKENNQINENSNVTYEIQKTPDNLVTEIMKGEVDVAIVPSNLAAQAYNKNLGYKLVGTVGWGSMFLISTDGSKTLEELKGKEIYNTGKGLTPDNVFKSILEKNKIKEDFNLNYVNSASELAPSILGGKIINSIVPEPALSMIINKMPEKINIILDLNKEWKKLYGSEYGYPQSSLIVKEDLLSNGDFVNDFTKELDKSITFIYENPEEASNFCKDIGINVVAEGLIKSLDRINLRYVPIMDSTDDYINYFTELFNFEPKTIGGKVPDENIFYKR